MEISTLGSIDFENLTHEDELANAISRAISQDLSALSHILRSTPIDFQLTLDDAAGDMLESIIEELKNTTATKNANERKLRRHVSLILANLLKQRVPNGNPYVSVPLRPIRYIRRYVGHDIGYKPTIRALTGLRELGYIEIIRGSYDRTRAKGYASRIEAAPRLNSVFRRYLLSHDAVQQLPHEPETIILKNAAGEKINYRDNNDTCRMRALLTRYNALLRATNLAIAPDEDRTGVNFSQNRVHRVFNNGSFALGGRFYGPWWVNNKTVRPHILIDEEPTVQFDYRAQTIHLLYSEEGLNYEKIAGDDDPYSLSGEPAELRFVRKAVLLSALNANAPRGACLAALKQIREQRPDLRTSDLHIPSLLNAFREKHAAIGKHFYTNPSLRLQNLDSKITEYIIESLLNAGIVVLTIHDSFIVQTKYSETLQNLMARACAHFRLSSPPPIRRVN